MSRDFTPSMDGSPFEADHPPSRVAQEVYHRAANDPDLPDESFVMVSRAMRGKDPLTGDEPTPQPERYWVDVDGYSDLTLWRGTPGDPKPTAVATKHTGRAEEWELVVRGAGLDPETVCVSRDELLAVLDHVGSTMRTVNGEVLR